MDIGHDQIKIDPQADALMKLHDLLKARNAGSFGSLDDDQRREYFADHRRRNRAKERAAAALPPTAANVRLALADAALMILATGAPGADQVRAVLGQIFAKRPGVPLSVETRAKRGKLRTKLIAVNNDISR